MLLHAVGEHLIWLRQVLELAEFQKMTAYTVMKAGKFPQPSGSPAKAMGRIASAKAHRLDSRAVRQSTTDLHCQNANRTHRRPYFFARSQPGKKRVSNRVSRPTIKQHKPYKIRLTGVISRCSFHMTMCRIIMFVALRASPSNRLKCLPSLPFRLP
jgi:hypothetical protein